MIFKDFEFLISDAEKNLGFFYKITDDNEIFSVNNEYDENINYIKNGLKLYKKSIRNKMKNFLNAKNMMLDEAMKFSKYIESVVIPKVPPGNLMTTFIYNVSCHIN